MQATVQACGTARRRAARGNVCGRRRAVKAGTRRGSGRRRGGRAPAAARRRPPTPQRGVPGRVAGSLGRPEARLRHSRPPVLLLLGRCRPPSWAGQLVRPPASVKPGGGACRCAWRGGAWGSVAAGGWGGQVCGRGAHGGRKPRAAGKQLAQNERESAQGGRCVRRREARPAASLGQHRFMHAPSGSGFVTPSNARRRTGRGTRLYQLC